MIPEQFSITTKFFPLKEFVFPDHRITNELVVIMRDGTYKMVPRFIKGRKLLKEFFGIRYQHIVYIGFCPVAREAKGLKLNKKNLMSKDYYYVSSL